MVRIIPSRMYPKGNQEKIIAQASTGEMISLMQGDYGGTPTTVALDANGNIVAVMKGDYDGSLQTVSLDSQNRILSVVTDPEDVWGKSHQMGNAELAARLGSLSTFDRRGTVFAYDDFEDVPLKWLSSFGTDGGGTGHSITLSDEYPSRGSGCMKIVPPNATNDYSRAHRFIGGAATHKIGMEMNITFKGTVNIKPSIIFRAFTGTRQINAGIRLQQSGLGGLSYLHDLHPHLDASYTTFNDDFLLDKNTSYPLKFVVDLDNEKYVRCMFGGTEIDMSSYTPYAVDSTYCQRVQAEVYVVSNYADNPAMYFDDFILTIEEPA